MTLKTSFSSGSTSLPINRPICAFHQGTGSSGKLCVVGSSHMFSDQFIDKEENGKLFDVIIDYLTSDKVLKIKVCFVNIFFSFKFSL